jgi:hypothetical protein
MASGEPEHGLPETPKKQSPSNSLFPHPMDSSPTLRSDLLNGFRPVFTPVFCFLVRSFSLILGLPVLSALAQPTIDVGLYKTDAYTQTSATLTDYSAGSFSLSVRFEYGADPDSTRVQLRKPDGTFVSLISGTRGQVYSLDATFPTSAQRSAAYPDGMYQLVIKSGGPETTIPLTVNFTAIAPPTVTNFADLQAITGPTAQINWAPIPKGGSENEELSWRLTDANKELLQRREIPDPRQTSFTAQDLLSELPMIGALYYFRFSSSTANDTTTRVAVGSGVNVSFPVYRIAGVPQPPAAFGGYASGSGEVTLSWQLVPGSDDQTSYRLERSTSRDFPALETTSFLINASLTSFTDRSVGPIPTPYFYRLMAVNAKGPSLPSAIAEIQTLGTIGSGATRLTNIASRARCGRGTSVTIGGFVVTGTQSKRVLVRAVGPTLATQGLSSEELLKDPTLTLYKDQTVVAANDNWGTNSNVADIITLGAQLGATPLAATDTTSAVLLIDLPPGVYSFVVNGKNDSEGIVLLEVYDANPSSDSRFANIATRAYSTTGDGVTIGGFVISGETSKQVLLRAIGPGLVAQGLQSYEVLADPLIEVHRGAATIATNDNWKTNESYEAITAQGNRIGAAPIAASDDRSAALLLRLPPGVYSFVASGRKNSSGIVLVEVYDSD